MIVTPETHYGGRGPGCTRHGPGCCDPGMTVSILEDHAAQCDAAPRECWLVSSLHPAEQKPLSPSATKFIDPCSRANVSSMALLCGSALHTRLYISSNGTCINLRLYKRDPK